MRHEFDLVPVAKSCITGSGPCQSSNATSLKTSFVQITWRVYCRRVTIALSLTFCVKKPNGKCCIVHSNNKLNAVTIPAQILILYKDVLQNNMVGCTMYSDLDLVDGYCQLLMRVSDIPLSEVSTPSGMLWEWLVMSHGLSNTQQRLTVLLHSLLSSSMP